MVHRTTAGGAPDHVDVMFLHKIGVDFCGGVLVLSHHNGVVVLPEQQVGTILPVSQHGLLKGQVVGRVRAVGLQI